MVVGLMWWWEPLGGGTIAAMGTLWWLPLFLAWCQSSPGTLSRPRGAHAVTCWQPGSGSACSSGF